MSTKLIFRSGLDTIGGTIVEVIKDNNRLVFDFGTVFDPASDDEKLPNVEGIYTNLNNKYNDAVLISHLHLDHTKALNLIDKDIPIYMSELSNYFLRELLAVGFNQIKGKERLYNGVEVNKKIKVNGFDVTFIPVDHDVIGACAILIENEDIAILYTGDYRFSGRNHKLMEQLINKGLTCDVVISEGVSVSFIDDDFKIIASNEVEEYETDFVNKVEVKDTYNNILFNTYIMGIERLESVCELAEKLDKDIYMYGDKYELAMTYLSDYAQRFKLITDERTINNQIVEFKFDRRNENIETYKNSLLLQSGGEPLGDYDPRYEELINYTNENNIELLKIGISGHATPQNLIWFLDNIKHDYLIPLHSFKRYLVKSKNSEQLLVKQDKEIIFNKHKLEIKDDIK